MGRRSTSTTKSGKFMNPTDQARKEARKKELKKNKKQRKMVRETVLKLKDPKSILEEMHRIDMLEIDAGVTTLPNEKALKDKKRKMKETLDRVLILYEKQSKEKFDELKKLQGDFDSKRLKHLYEFQAERMKERDLEEQLRAAHENADMLLPEIPLPHSGALQPSDIPLPVPAGERVILPPPSLYGIPGLPPGLVPPGPPPGSPPRHRRDSHSSGDSDFSGSSSDEESEDSDSEIEQEGNTDDPNRRKAVHFSEEADIREFDKDDPDAANTSQLQKNLLKIAGHANKEQASADSSKDAQRPPMGDGGAPPEGKPFMPPHGMPPHFLSRPPPGGPMPRMMPPGPPPGRPPGPPPGLPPMPMQGGMPMQMPPRPRFPPGGMPPPRMMMNPSMQPLPFMPMMNPHEPHAILSAPPSMLSKPPSIKKAEAELHSMITAKPQLRNIRAEVTKLVPTSVRVRRDMKTKGSAKEIRIAGVDGAPQPKDETHSIEGPTKDDVYSQFMGEMEGFL